MSEGVRSRGGGLSILGTALLTALLGVAAAARSQEAPAELAMAPVDSLLLPPGEVRGMAWIAYDTLAVLCVVPDSLSATGRRQVPLHLLDAAGNLLATHDFTGTLERGLAHDGAFFWSCGDEADGGSLLYKIDADTLNVEEAYGTPGHRPCGLAWDGQYVWIVDRDSGRLDRFDPETESVTRSLPTPGFSPAGVAHDGTHAWVSDAGTGRLYRLSGSRGRWSGTVRVEDFAFRGRDVVLALQGGTLWYAPVGGAHAYRVMFP
jgi:hypothetical protein